MSVSSAPLVGKVAFIQGDSHSIGATTVRRPATKGVSVTFIHISLMDKPQTLAAEPEGAGVSILVLHADSVDAATLVAAVDEAAVRFGCIGALINNAAAFVLGSVEELPLVDFEWTLAINVHSIFVAAQTAVKHVGDSGRAISIGSTSAERMPFVCGATCAMSKSAPVGLTKDLARDLDPHGIAVNSVQPSPVGIDMNPDGGDFAKTLKDLTALPRYARSEEIVNLVIYLAESEAVYITGASLTIGGGFSA